MTAANSPLGILVLDTTFDRVPEDIGNPESFDYPVILQVVPGASTERALGQQDDSLISLFAEYAQKLVDAGARSMTTSCGFLARYQSALAPLIDVQFLSSSLCLLPAAERHFGHVGVLTADRSRLTEEHFSDCGASMPKAIMGMEGREHFRSAILEEKTPLDIDRMGAEVVQAAIQLQRENPELDAILLECTNLPPYRSQVASATGLPVIDALNLADHLTGHRPLTWE